MNGKKLLFKADKAGFALCAVFLGTLTGCMGYVERPREHAYVAPPMVETSIVMQDDYVYYPGYEVYYSNSRRQFIYLEGRSWVTRPAPPRVSVDVLFASPSVRLDFHDSPEIHHSTVVRQYPRNWRPPGAGQGRNDEQPGQRGQPGRGGQRGDYNGR
jgi:hypothetical protein